MTPFGYSFGLVIDLFEFPELPLFDFCKNIDVCLLRF